MKIFYLDFYFDEKLNIPKRSYPLAGVNKAEYIIKSLESIGETVVVSPCSVADGSSDKSGFYEFGKKSFLKTFYSIEAHNSVFRWFRRKLIDIQCFSFLIKKMKKDDILLVYHSIYYMNMVRAVKTIKKVKTILQIEEIYSDVNNNDVMKQKELKYFHIADGYMFPTELLERKINLKKKYYSIVYGNYTVPPIMVAPPPDGKTHCVYAGTLDPRKGGAIAAVEAAEFLPYNFHVHILGFGTNEQVKDILAKINSVSENAKSTVTYDGVLTGDAFSSFLQTCHIGLCTQNPNASFNDSSFPSKILTYLGNGLKVVCPHIPAVYNSKINCEIEFYNEANAEGIAKAIMNVSVDLKNNRELLARLDADFKEEIKEIINNVIYL